MSKVVYLSSYYYIVDQYIGLNVIKCDKWQWMIILVIELGLNVYK